MYPEDIDAILQTWKTRDDAWLKIKEGTGRENSCRKYGGKMICIDEYSHEGNAQSHKANDLLIRRRSHT